MRRKTKGNVEYIKNVLLEDGYKESDLERNVNDIFAIAKEYKITVEEVLLSGEWQIII